MVQDLYVLMITAAVVSLVFKFLKQPVVLGYIVAGVLVGPNLFGGTWVNEVVLHRSGVPPQEPHQQRQGGSNRLNDHHLGHDVAGLLGGKGC